MSHRFPLVQSLDGLKSEQFVDPEAGGIKPESVIGEVKIDGSLSELLLQEAEAGRPVVLRILPVRRLNGVFIIAGALSAIPVELVHVAGGEFKTVETIGGEGEKLPEEKLPAGDSTK